MWASDDELGIDKPLNPKILTDSKNLVELEIIIIYIRKY